MSADEFEVIRKVFAPLATHPGARGLIDDAAVLETKGRLVVTTDAIVEGAHFLTSDPLDTVAKKVLRVNLSDVTAKGAKCVGIVLSLMWPKARPAEQIADFARGLGEDLKFYDVPLLGGDTTSTQGPLCISVTAFGEPLGSRTPSRADARVGEHVWLTGTIGDAFLGLQQLTSPSSVVGAAATDQSDAHARFVRQRYRVPEPPVRAAQLIADFASASIDISDGLAADAEKIATASGVALRLDAEAIPISAAGHAYVARGGAEALGRLITGGDDYQTLLTVAPEHRGAIVSKAKELDLELALIGDVEAGAGARIVGPGGINLHLPALGHRHRLGR